MKFAVKNRRSGEVQFEADIECDENASLSVELGLAVKWAIENKMDLSGANLSDDFTMPDGMLFSAYLRDVVPALLTAGGKTIKQIVDGGSWDCHDWSNCPMHAAFGIDSSDQGPPLLRGRIREFIQLFDSGLIPEPTIPPEPKAEPEPEVQF